MRLVSTLMKSLFLLLHIAIVLYVKPALAQGGPTGGGTSGNSYPCLSNVTITNGYRCANDQGVAYNYPQVYKTHLDESNNTVVDHQDPMAAKIGTTLNVTLNVTRSTLAQNNYTGTLTITAMYFTQGGIVFVPCDNVTPLSNLMPGFSADVTFSLGALPNYVTKGDLVIFFNGDGYIDGMYEETLYLVYNQPAAPQAIPWIGVLEDACIFAHGQSSDMTVSKELTFGVFFGGNFGVQSKRYFKATGIPHHIDMGWGPVEGDHKFLLTEFLSIQGETLGNCVDVSTYLAICANALGLNFSLGNYKDTNNAVFYTNNMNFIGMNVFNKIQWTNHQIAHSLDSSGLALLVHDAFTCHIYDPFGYDWNAPPSGWGFANYWFSLPSDTSPRGLVSFPNPSSPLSIATSVLDVK